MVSACTCCGEQESCCSFFLRSKYFIHKKISSPPPVVWDFFGLIFPSELIQWGEIDLCAEGHTSSIHQISSTKPSAGLLHRGLISPLIVVFGHLETYLTAWRMFGGVIHVIVIK